MSCWIRDVFILRASELLDHSVSHQPGLKGIPPIRKKHMDRMFLSSACESLDQGWIRVTDMSRDREARHQPGLKKHTDRVFLSIACEPSDQVCVSFEGL